MTVEPFVDALLTRRAHLFSRIRHHLDEVVDVDRLIARHVPGHEPLDREWMLPFTDAPTEWVKVPATPIDDEAAQAEFGLVDADDGPALSPSGASDPVDEDRDEHAPDVLPGPADLPSADDLPAVDPPAVGVSKAGGWNYAAVAQAVRDAVDAGTGDAVDRVMALRPGCSASAASQAIVKARKLGHHVPSLRTTPSAPAADEPPAPETEATTPDSVVVNVPATVKVVLEKGPVRHPAERGKVIACVDCDWATGPSRVRDLIAHTLANHDRRPSDSERRPVKAADA